MKLNRCLNIWTIKIKKDDEANINAAAAAHDLNDLLRNVFVVNNSESLVSSPPTTTCDDINSFGSPSSSSCSAALLTSPQPQTTPSPPPPPLLDELAASLLDSSLRAVAEENQAYPNDSNFDIDTDDDEDDQETEAMLDNIERILNSMQDHSSSSSSSLDHTVNACQRSSLIPELQSLQQPLSVANLDLKARSNNRVLSSNKKPINKPVKLEPVDNTTTMVKLSQTSGFKKISPKMPSTGSQQATPTPISPPLAPQPTAQQVAILPATALTCSPIIIATTPAGSVGGKSIHEQAAEQPKTKRAKQSVVQQQQPQPQQTTTLILVPNTAASATPTARILSGNGLSSSSSSSSSPSFVVQSPSQNHTSFVQSSTYQYDHHNNNLQVDVIFVFEIVRYFLSFL